MKLDSRPIEPLSKRTRTLVLEQMRPDETVLLCIVGESGQALVALASRLLVVKAGLGARLSLSEEVASFDYAGVDDIELVAGEVNAIITVRPGRPAHAKEWWQARDPSEDPIRAMNAIVIPTARRSEYEPQVEELRRLVAGSTSRQGPGAETAVPGSQAAGGGAGETVSLLERLAALHASGSLSDEEFERAKRKLLG